MDFETAAHMYTTHMHTSPDKFHSRKRKTRAPSVWLDRKGCSSITMSIYPSSAFRTAEWAERAAQHRKVQQMRTGSTLCTETFIPGSAANEEQLVNVSFWYTNINYSKFLWYPRFNILDVIFCFSYIWETLFDIKRFSENTKDIHVCFFIHLLHYILFNFIEILTYAYQKFQEK